MRPPGPALVLNNCVITGGTFNAHTVQGEGDRRPTLESNVAFGALPNAAERYPMPRCYPGTRKSALLVVTDWISGKGDGAEKSIMWVTGAPGVGKTAILQTVCETLAGDNQPIAWLSSTVLAIGERFPILEATCSALSKGTSIDASFFFGRGEATREKAFYFPATIAYQIGQSRTSYRSAVKMELAKRPCTLCETFPSQFRRLIINPAKTLASFQNPITIVIDALDECDSIVDQVTLLNLILEACATRKIRFLIASRPEQEISSFFRRADVAQHIRHVQLDEESFSTSHDIELFLRSEFDRIRLSKPEACPRLPNGEEWPGSTVIRELATYSDSQFMFPHLVIEYIDTEFFSPNQQLQNLLTSPPPSVFKKLDSLYHLILSRRPTNPFHCPDADAEFNHYQDVVSGILQVIDLWPGGPFSAAQIAVILDEKVDVVQQTIRGPLRSLFKLSEDPDSVVTFCHKSLGDCLSDPRRAGEHFIPRNGLDLLYIRILSRQPPPSLLPPHYREALKGVILVLATWPIQTSIPEIASLLDLTPSVVQSVVSGPAQPLFTTNLEGVVFFSHLSIKNFFMDVDRSGEFFIPSDQPDALFIHILSRQPPSPDKGSWNTYSREVLIDVLRVVITWPGRLTVSDIAVTLDTVPSVVRSVLDRLPRSLFVPSRHRVAFNPRCGIKAFLLDANRSGEFFIPDRSPDALYTRLLSRRPPPRFAAFLTSRRLHESSGGGCNTVSLPDHKRYRSLSRPSIQHRPSHHAGRGHQTTVQRKLRSPCNLLPGMCRSLCKHCGENAVPTKEPNTLFVEILSCRLLAYRSAYPRPVHLATTRIPIASVASFLRCYLTILEVLSALDVHVKIVGGNMCDNNLVSLLFGIRDKDHRQPLVLDFSY